MVALGDMIFADKRSFHCQLQPRTSQAKYEMKLLVEYFPI